VQSPQQRLSRSSRLKSVASLALLIALAIFEQTVGAQEEGNQPQVLRVCQDPGNLPFSNEAGEGLENRIAALLAAHMGLPLETYWYPQRMNVVRNTIRYKLPGQTHYRCDLLTGVPAGWGPVSTTRPYYRSTHVLVYVKGRGLDIDSGDAFLALDRETLAGLKIGIFDRSPAARWLKNHGLLEQAVPYRMMNADPGYYPGKIIDHDLVQGKIDVAILWGPIAGYFAKQVKDAVVEVVPLKSEPNVPFDYSIAMGVRHGETQWRDRVDAALDDLDVEIKKVLREFGVPLVDESGAPE
jgi:mxaJ protein